MGNLKYTADLAKKPCHTFPACAFLVVSSLLYHQTQGKGDGLEKISALSPSQSMTSVSELQQHN